MESIKELFKGLELDESVFSEAVVDKMAVVMESQLVEAEKAIEAKLEEKYEAELVEYKEFLEDQLDGYLNEFTTEFVENNKEQIHESVKVKTAEKVLSKFASMVEDFNIALSEDSITDSIESDSLKEQLNAKVNENIQLKEELAAKEVSELIENVSADIDTDSTREKFASIAESLSFTGKVEFEAKLNDLKESLSFNNSSAQTLEESEVIENQSDVIEENTNISSSQKAILAALQGGH